MQTFFKRTYDARFFLASLLVLTSVILLNSPSAEAMPSFSRQTGQACSTCHTQSFGPNLTPFGRDFKLSGYTMGGGSELSRQTAASQRHDPGIIHQYPKRSDVQSADRCCSAGLPIVKTTILPLIKRL